jgi:hypothetical protein|tara:strand:+ start:89 stop:307 length:219 start_codon:yes stop_codon:yes gene_type:complete
MTSKGDEDVFSMLDLSANGRDYLLTIAKELAKDPEKEAFGIEVQDGVGVTYKLVVWLDEFPEMILVEGDTAE